MALVPLGGERKLEGGTIATVLFSWGGGDWAAPPLSCERACNEMEMLRGLPGTGPALCSTDRVATPNGGGAFPATAAVPPSIS